MTLAMASESDQNEGSLSFPHSTVMVDREVEDHENGQDLRMEPSLHQVKSAIALQQVTSAGIPQVPDVEFRPTTRLYLAFGTLAVITLMVALDGTSISVALPVSPCPSIPAACGYH